MKARALMVIVAVGAFTAGGRLVVGQHGVQLGIRGAAPAYSIADASVITGAGLPSEEMAKTVLSAALMHRHPQWIDIPAGSATIRSFVVFPESAKNSPVLVITSNNQGLSDWLRAVGDQAAAEGFIAVVPDLLSGMGPRGGDTDAFANRDAIVQALAHAKDAIASRAAAVQQYAVRMPGSNGNSATVNFNFASASGRIDVSIQSPERSAGSFELRDHAWHNALAFLAARLEPPAAQQAGRAGQAGRGEAEGGLGGMRSKRADLPANFLMAAKTVATSPRKGEWINIPMAGGTRLRTWISYPQGNTRAPMVLVFEPGPGIDMGEPPTRGGGANWLRAIADQLASEGFIAVLPDLASGTGPNGGNSDSFEFADDVGRAKGSLGRPEVLNRVRAARDYALKLPMANGKVATIGFCGGATLSWESAAEVEGVNAAVVFYGGPPNDNVMARIKAPVAAYFGANDLGLAPRIAPATAAMKKHGKPFEVEVYQEATHVFLYRQDLGKNMAATEDSWPKAVAFMKKHTMSPPAGSR